jgi:hypothetical protein
VKSSDEEVKPPNKLVRAFHKFVGCFDEDVEPPNELVRSLPEFGESSAEHLKRLYFSLNCFMAKFK